MIPQVIAYRKLAHEGEFVKLSSGEWFKVEGGVPVRQVNQEWHKDGSPNGYIIGDRMHAYRDED